MYSSAFPPLNPKVRYRTAMERAGFDVNRDRKISTGTSSTSMGTSMGNQSGVFYKNSSSTSESKLNTRTGIQDISTLSNHDVSFRSETDLASHVSRGLDRLRSVVVMDEDSDKDTDEEEDKEEEDKEEEDKEEDKEEEEETEREKVEEKVEEKHNSVMDTVTPLSFQTFPTQEEYTQQEIEEVTGDTPYATQTSQQLHELLSELNESTENKTRMAHLMEPKLSTVSEAVESGEPAQYEVQQQGEEEEQQGEEEAHEEHSAHNGSENSLSSFNTAVPEVHGSSDTVALPTPASSNTPVDNNEHEEEEDNKNTTKTNNKNIYKSSAYLSVYPEQNINSAAFEHAAENFNALKEKLGFMESQDTEEIPLESAKTTIHLPGEGPCRKCGEEIDTTRDKAIYSKTHSVTHDDHDDSKDTWLSGQWHRRCFQCTLCDVKFSKKIQCYILDDTPYCEHHYHVTNNSVCTLCSKYIEGECLENDQEERFHVTCLTCYICKQVIANDYYIYNNNLTICDNHDLDSLLHTGNLGEEDHSGTLAHTESGVLDSSSRNTEKKAQDYFSKRKTRIIEF